MRVRLRDLRSPMARAFELSYQQKLVAVVASEHIQLPLELHDNAPLLSVAVHNQRVAESDGD